MYSNTSLVSARRVGHEERCTSSFLSVAKKLLGDSVRVRLRLRLMAPLGSELFV